MAEAKDWRDRWRVSAQLLEQQTGAGVDEWNRRVAKTGIATKSELTSWLTEQGVEGFARTMLLNERFGYPAFTLASATELIDRQYADRQHLREVYELLVAAAEELGDVELQARKGYVALRTPRRKFATIKASTRSRVDLGLRIEGAQISGRLESAASLRDESSTVRIALGRPEEVDDEVVGWLSTAYDANL